MMEFFPIKGDMLCFMARESCLNPRKKARPEFFWVYSCENAIKCVVRWDAIREGKERAKPSELLIRDRLNFYEIISAANNTAYRNSNNINKKVLLIVIFTIIVNRLEMFD